MTAASTSAPTQSWEASNATTPGQNGKLSSAPMGAGSVMILVTVLTMRTSTMSVPPMTMAITTITKVLL